MNKLLKISIPVLLILGLILSAGCAPAAPTPMPAPVPEEGLPPPPGAPPPMQSGGKTYTSDSDESRSVSIEYDEVTVDRKIVRTGHLTLEVEDIVETIDEVAALAEELGGYVVSSQKREREDRTSGHVFVRIPVERFDEAFDRLRQLAVDVPYESTEGRDVTEEYTDLEAQLHNLEATEAQYLVLLEKAEKVEDILNVQRELSSVRGVIERIKGRMQYLERTSDMSLIEISLQETKPLGTTGWSAFETFKSAISGLITFGKVLANIAIWLAVFCPIWIAVIFLIRFILRRRKAKAASS